MKVRLLVLIVLLGMAGAAWARNAPDFTLPDPDGNQVSLSSYRGKHVVLEFLMTTCPHCQRAGEVLQKLYAEFPNRLVVIGIAMDGNAVAGIRTYKQDHGINFPVVAGDLMVAMNYLGITPQRPNFHVPVFFVISPKGEIVEEKNPERPEDKEWYANTDQNLEAMVRRIVPPEKPAKAGKPGASGARHAASRKHAAKP